MIQNNFVFYLSQYDPDLVLISAGYDVALGCPEVNRKIISMHKNHSIPYREK